MHTEEPYIQYEMRAMTMIKEPPLHSRQIENLKRSP